MVRSFPEGSRVHSWKRGFAVADPQVDATGVHVWQFDPDLAVDVIYHQLSGRQPFRMNRHNYLELVYVCSGEIVWQVHDRLVSQKAGDLFVMGSTTYHRLTENSKPQVKASTLFFMPDVVRTSSASGDDVGYLLPFTVQDSKFPHVLPARTGIPEQVANFMKRIHKELPATSGRARLAVKTYLKMILILLVNHYTTYRGTTDAFDRRQLALKRLSPLFDFLEKNYGQPLEVRDVVGTVGMSKSHFMRFFKQVTGQSFVSYLNHFRLAKAQPLLRTTEKPISEISLEVGFCDQSYFGLVFRKLLHVTPLQYRHNLAETHLASGHGSRLLPERALPPGEPPFPGKMPVKDTAVALPFIK